MYEHERQRVLLELDTLGIDFRTPEEQASHDRREIPCNPQQCGRGQVASIREPLISDREIWLIIAILTLTFLMW